MSVPETPAELRARLLARRRALAPGTVTRLSRETVDRFLSRSGIAPSRWNGLHVALYRAVPGELDLRPLEPLLRGWGARLCYPRVLDRQAHLMEFAALPGLDPSESAPWPSGAFGIEEPPPHFEAVDPALLDVIFVPGVAFGPGGERMGMGAGFYDRYLPAASRALKVALTFDFQLLPELEQRPWDQRVDWIFTELREARHRSWP